MDARLKELEAWGCDVKSGIALAMENEDLYLECLNDTVSDEGYDVMLKALKDGDIHKAFDASHTLKGLYANLGLTPMYNKSLEIVEPLRAGRGDNLLGKAEELITMNAYILEVLQGK